MQKFVDIHHSQRALLNQFSKEKIISQMEIFRRIIFFFPWKLICHRSIEQIDQEKQTKLQVVESA